ncbi:MAG TPA: hypothetical protein VGR24_08415 [bacterium]|jgi:hypothetical protein|nr:hypothetical protein [bacterium]
MRLRRLSALGLLSALALGCAAAPAISWDPQPLAVAMEPNAFRVLEASLRPAVPIASLELTPSATLRPVLAVIPSTVVGIDAGSARRVRLAVLLPPTAAPGERISGVLNPGLRVTIGVVPPTAEGALESARLALEHGDEAAYLAQVAPDRRAAEQRTFAGLTDAARLALAGTLQTAERISLEGDRSEYRIYLLLGTQRLESSIVLQRFSDGIWRIVRF